jgi:catechol 2,3-dioxygenase-like lactoylglutathione lyase family enzyme
VSNAGRFPLARLNLVGGNLVMKATCVTHVGVCVRDMEKSLAFYRDALGMKVLGEKTTDPSERGQQGGRTQNYKRQRRVRRWVSLAYGEGATPTLTLTSHPGEEPDGAPIQLDQVGISHISFGVHDVKALADALTAKGYELAGPAESFLNASGEMRSIYVFDPDGILVQFNNPDGGG